MEDKRWYRNAYIYVSILLNIIIWRIIYFVEWIFIFIVITGKGFNNKIASNWERGLALLLAISIILIVIFINYKLYKVNKRLGGINMKWLLIPLATSILTVAICIITF